MEWKTLAASATAERLPVLEDLFWRTGAVSVTVVDGEENPIFEPGPGEIPLWDNVTATGLYEDAIDVAQIRDEMKQAGLNCSL